MASPKIRAWIHRFSQEPGGLNTFIDIQHIIQIHRTVLNPQGRSIHPTDLSLLLVTITWGALLDTDSGSSAKVALADDFEEMTKLLLRQADNVDKFLALVAALCLAERMNHKELYALILGCAGTASSLKIQMRTVVRASCLSEEQATRVEQALRTLYCIDKSYALRWQTLPLVSKEALPVVNTRNDPTLRKDTSAVSAELLHVRTQYAHLCLHIVELRKTVDENASNSFIGKITELATALDEWHETIAENPFISSLEERIARRVKHQAFCFYHEALLHLVSIYSSNQCSSLNPLHQKWEEIRRRSTREVILACYAISSDDLPQDQ
ncbi:hypothetical protein PTTW11_01450 [Pyrenophora teres f. teres]|uniref:Uncharacterized protein n=1 Tax=Pyrenophora teres f. teres TaxID=97479 RepID=A0A6S6VBN1_9PLEO|nr:hypothetical protein PTTW11_01450 [Pyrenophora teres f. teres]